MTKVLGRLDPLLLVLVAFAALLRLYDVNWDQGFHLHPDERFLSTLVFAARIPGSLRLYLDPTHSPLNPSNTGSHFFVYGILPLTLDRLLAVMLGTHTYDALTIQGRALSALADVGTVLLVYLTARLLERPYRLNRRVAYLAAFFYSAAVLPVQLAHFFTVESFLTLAMFSSLYCCLRRSLGGSVTWILLGAAALGAALACKLSALAILPIDIFLIALAPIPERIRRLRRNADYERLVRFVGHRPYRCLKEGVAPIALFCLMVYLWVRLFDPYYFQTGNILNATLSTDLRTSLSTLSSLSISQGFYPPAIQWIGQPPVFFSLKNLIVFGLGVPFAACAVVGSYVAARLARIELLAMMLWMIAFFLYQSSQFVQTMRYFIFLYPLFALLAALGFDRAAAYRPVGLPAVLAVLVLLWPLAFMSIYTHDHSRVMASRWMYRNLVNGSTIATEAWDDPLPLTVPGTGATAFDVEQLPIFEPDTSTQKWRTIRAVLQRARYIVLSSNRGWGSIGAVPAKYPLAARYYHDLFGGRLYFRRIKTFTSYPSLRYLGIPIDFPDGWAEEAFTVYDHPQVIIFEKTR